MEEQFPRTGKNQTGGAQVIFCRACSCGSSGPGNAAPVNLLKQAKRRRFDFYTRAFARDLPLISSRNRFACRKSFPNRDASRPRPNTREIARLVTTTHLLLPN